MASYVKFDRDGGQKVHPIMIYFRLLSREKGEDVRSSPKLNIREAAGAYSSCFCYIR